MNRWLLLFFILATANLAVAREYVSSASVVGAFHIRPEVSNRSLAIKRYAKDMTTILEKDNPKTLNSFFIFKIQRHLLDPYRAPSFFQFLTLSTEGDYNKATQHPEHLEKLKTLYSQLFEPDFTHFMPSKNFFVFTPSQLQPNTAYDFMGYPVNWKRGHTVGRLIVRRATDTPNAFLKKASKAYKFYGQSFRNTYLKGLLVYANENYIVSIENWLQHHNFNNIKRTNDEFKKSHELINDMGNTRAEVDITPIYAQTSLTKDIALFRFLTH